MKPHVLLALLPVLGMFACDDGSSSGPGPIDEGVLIVDSAWVIDAYNFSSAACAEVLPSAFANIDSVPSGTLAAVTVISTACYSVHVRVEDSAAHVVRTFNRYFGIFNRQDGDKNRGEAGYVTWDGTDDQGRPVPLARYLWRMEFNFGAGHVRKVRADIRLD
jgi:hypothetical protein